jgi:ribonuclease P/MRP protein subunit RPP1
MSTRYEAVYADPDGQSTVSRLAGTAADYGFDGLIVRNHGEDPASYDPEAVREATDIDVVTGVEVRAPDPSRASGYVATHREETEVICVHGGDPAINRFAVRQPRVDVLSHPTAGEGDSGLDHVLVSAAAEHDVALEVNLAPVLRDTGGSRVQHLRALRKLRELLEDADAPFVVSAGAESHLHLRAWREVVAVGGTIGFEADAIEAGLSAWGEIARRNRRRLADEVDHPGVWLDRPDEG